MSELAFIRHGRTQWNADRRLTGRADIALSAEGVEHLRRSVVAAHWFEARWHVSPLRRARETAELLGASETTVDQRLVEMDFGVFEGRTLSELREDPELAMAALEARGLDFLPPAGESPRMVQARLKPFLADIAAAGGRHVAVAHKSVIRAAMALAYDWPMPARPPVRLDWDCAHVFNVSAAGSLRPQAMNVPLDQAAAELGNGA